MPFEGTVQDPGAARYASATTIVKQIGLASPATAGPWLRITGLCSLRAHVQQISGAAIPAGGWGIEVKDAGDGEDGAYFIPSSVATIPAGNVSEVFPAVVGQQARVILPTAASESYNVRLMACP